MTTNHVEQRDEVDPSAPVSTEELEERATAARARLLEAVGALDQKRHQLARRGRVVFPAAIAVGALAVGSLVALAIVKRKRPASSGLFVARSREPSMLGQVARHVGVTLITFAITQVGKAAIKKLIPTGGEVEPTRDQARRP